MRRKLGACQIAGVKSHAMRGGFTASGSSLSSFTGTSFCPSQGSRRGCVSCRGVRDQPWEAQTCLGSMCQIRQHLHNTDEQGSSCFIPKPQPAGAGDAMCLWPHLKDPGEELDELTLRSQSPALWVCPKMQPPAPQLLPARAGE